MKQLSLLKKRSDKINDDLFFIKEINKLSSESLKQELIHNQKINQKLLLHILQRHLSLIKLQEILLITAFITAGVLGRIILQVFPSVEPITFFAILAGSLFGWKRGAFTGASSWYLSNFFVFGGQGPWTIVHVASGAMAGLLGGLLLKKPTYAKTIIVMLITTIIFELAINTMSGILFYGLIISFITAIPFTIIHITSNVLFSSVLPSTRKKIVDSGRLDEKEICKNLINRLKILNLSNQKKEKNNGN